MRAAHNCWKAIIGLGLQQDKGFQKLVIEDMDMPNIIKWDSVKVEPAWLIGLYLPGFFHLFQRTNTRVLILACDEAVVVARGRAAGGRFSNGSAL